MMLATSLSGAVRRPTRRAVLLLAGSLGAWLAAACSKGGDAAEAEEAVPPVVGARTALVTAQPFVETVSAIGTVVGRAGHVALLSVPAAGRVSRVLVTTGQRVSAGQALVELDPSLFTAAVQSATAALTAAQQNADRTQRLVTEGIAPRRDAELAAADLARVQADLIAVRRQAQLATVRSPIAGVVTRLTATLGGTADPAQPLVEVTDPSVVDILMSATPTDAGRIRPGATVTLSAGQNAGGEALGTGTVADIAAAVDSATRSVAVRVRVPSARRQLRIGETVFGQIAVATRATAIVVPNEALVPSGDGYQVFVVDSANVAHATAVEVGARRDSLVEITRGLTAGQRIVTYGAYGVADSARVVPPEQAGRSQPADTTTATRAKP